MANDNNSPNSALYTLDDQSSLDYQLCKAGDCSKTSAPQGPREPQVHRVWCVHHKNMMLIKIKSPGLSAEGVVQHF